MSSSRIAIIFTPVVNRIILPKLGNLNGKVHSITVFLHSDVSVQVSESISTITEVVTVDDEDGYYIALNRKLYSLVNADVPILFVSPEYYFDVDSIASLEMTSIGYRMSSAERGAVRDPVTVTTSGPAARAAGVLSSANAGNAAAASRTVQLIVDLMLVSIMSDSRIPGLRKSAFG